jgi:diguanylate cyclase (GGDEF)-like protein
MKVLRVLDDVLSGARRRTAMTAAASGPVGETARADNEIGLLGLDESELTTPVRGALTMLLSEIDDLRQEVVRLKARLDEAELLADRDSLTPLLNRRAFLREMRRMAAFAHRYGSSISLVYFDIDGFKAINDQFGHAAGDVALQAVARRLVANVRESDLVGRLGGDEFAVILAQMGLPAAETKAAALAAAVFAEPVRRGDWLASIKVSYGVRQIEPDTDVEQVLALADAAMYAQKRSG